MLLLFIAPEKVINPGHLIITEYSNLSEPVILFYGSMIPPDPGNILIL